MLISIPFSLKKVSVEGVSIVVNSIEAQRIKNKYPSAKIKGLRKKTTKKQLHGPCKTIPVEQYLASVGGQ